MIGNFTIDRFVRDMRVMYRTFPREMYAAVEQLLCQGAIEARETGEPKIFDEDGHRLVVFPDSSIEARPPFEVELLKATIIVDKIRQRFGFPPIGGNLKAMMAKARRLEQREQQLKQAKGRKGKKVAGKRRAAKAQRMKKSTRGETKARQIRGRSHKRRQRS